MIRLRLAGYQPAHSVHSRSARFWCDALATAVQDELDIEFIANVTQAGVPMTSLPQRTTDGEFDAFYLASSYLAARCPSLAALDLPFPAKSRANLFRDLDSGALGRLLTDEVFERTGFRVLAFWDNGLRHLSNSVRPILRPCDCRGLTIRTLDNEFHQAVFRAMGFTPKFVDVRDFPAAIAKGMVEAQENPLTNVVTFGIQEHHRHVSLTGHFQGVALVLANGSWFDGLPDAVSDKLTRTLAEATSFQRSLAVQEDATCHDQLTAAGVAIVEPAAIDLAAFRAAMRPLVAAASDRLGATLVDLVR